MTSSEVHSYVFIKNSLEELGWIVSNPERNSDGQLYTQHECLKNQLIKRYLVRDVPENIIVVRPNKFMVIEAKSKHNDMHKAVKEAKDYADALNSNSVICPIAVAVAGNVEDTYLVQNFFYFKGKWQEIKVNNRVTKGLLSPEIAQQLVDANTFEISDVTIAEDVLYAKATKINEILHLGSINKNQRARVMAALLLAMSDDARINVDNDAFSLISEINSKSEKILYQHNKGDFARCIAISTPPTRDNHVKFRKAILDTIQELEDLNIRSAMNSGTDILGRFYEVFLKYGNGAKEIGIVLTPRHITEMAAKAVRVTKRDKIFDPACGTGGFLVASFDQAKKDASEEELNIFKSNGIYGIEQEDEVLALALVNMIFRGDGKNNIVSGNCFSDRYFQNIKMSKVLMNPPFALKKEDEKEYKFIDFALRKMEEGGILLAILPSPVMFRGKNYKTWRENMLKEHTLKAVIKLPEDLFYPVGVHTSIVVIEAYKPHKQEDLVLWGSLADGYEKSKGVMIRNEKSKNNIDLFIQAIHMVLDNHSLPAQPREIKFAPIKFDKYLECTPEGYLTDKPPEHDQIIKNMKGILLNTLSSDLSGKIYEYN